MRAWIASGVMWGVLLTASFFAGHEVGQERAHRFWMVCMKALSKGQTHCLEAAMNLEENAD